MKKFFAFVGFCFTIVILIWALSQCLSKKQDAKTPDADNPTEKLTIKSVTFREPGKLIGKERTPHRELDAADVALKNSISFVLCDWEAYSETLPLEEAAKWKNKKVSPGQQETRKRTLETNRQYTVSSSEINGDNAAIIVSENINGAIYRYDLRLKKTASGWVVTGFEQLKK